MKKKNAVLTCLLCLGVFNALGDEDARFHAKEWDLSPFVTYVNKVGNDWGAGASITYFLSERFGLGATTYWTDLGGTFIDNLAAEGTFRLPLLKIVAPYAVGSIGYQFDSGEWVETLGAGVDFRPFKSLSVFSDVQWRFANETKDGVFLRLGIRFSF